MRLPATCWAAISDLLADPLSFASSSARAAVVRRNDWCSAWRRALPDDLRFGCRNHENDDHERTVVGKGSSGRYASIN